MMATALTNNFNNVSSNNSSSSISSLMNNQFSHNSNSSNSNGYHHHMPSSINILNNIHNHHNAQHSSSSQSPNLFRVGDFVYIEVAPTSPYMVAKIEELVKNQSGNPEVKLVLFYRRRDMSGSLFQQIEKQQISALEEEQEKEFDQFSEKEKHQIKLRELFLSRQIETYPVSTIRGKCLVTLLSEAESLYCYLKKDDIFFYTQVYDPEQKSLAEADRGEIRVGQRYQAEVPAQTLEDPPKEDTRKLKDLETLVYSPDHQLSDEKIDQYLMVAKSIGTYARALDCSSSVKQPSLLMSAASASRDCTVQYAMDVLHKCDYDLAKAVCFLVPKTGPILCRDEMEEWSTAETGLFDEAIDKCEKRFEDIQQNFLPWKSIKNLIEYYYFWKTTDRYVQRKRVKAVENDSKLKQVFVPSFNNKQSSTSVNGSNDLNSNKQCESCKKTSSSNWHIWGSANLQCFICQSCWNFWRKFGAFKYPNRIADMNAEKLQVSFNLSTTQTVANNTVRSSPVNDVNAYSCRDCNKVFNRQERLISHLASHRPHKCNITSCGKEFKFKAHLARHCANSHGLAMRSGSPRPIMKTRAAFYYNVVPSLRLARNLCSDVLNLKKAARKSFPINLAVFKQEYAERYQKGLNKIPKLKKIDRGRVVDISHRLGTPDCEKPEWLIALPKEKIPQPTRLAFPPTKSEDSEFDNQVKTNENSKKRPLEYNGNFIPSKRRQMAPPSILGKSVPDLYENISRNSVSTQSLNGRAKIATITNLSGKKQMISWVDAPDDVFFFSTKKIRQLRRKIPLTELLRAARQPYKQHSEYLSSFFNPPSSSSSSYPGPTTTSSSSSTTTSAAAAAAAANQILSNLASARSGAQLSNPALVPGVNSTNKLNIHNPSSAAVAAAAAAALNLSNISSVSSSQQQVLALLQQQMLAPNLPLLGPNANHLISSNAFLNNLSHTNGGSGGSGSSGKINR
ncbi:Metastasis-associated protein MTA3 [Sarcoptes scabiei]|uniref:Metastasis-associated protein MTA3 n=1 Tax=Sarcoptes scabiei TaxID=52283 RepID=A0A834V8P7_SARSC|nr:Metastasis-associated protein MTA3 [Sarcoptes scabiei]